jgi:hypothetical protein
MSIHLLLVTASIPRRRYKRRQGPSCAASYQEGIIVLVNRRELAALAAGGMAAANAIAPAGPTRAASGAKIKAIAFDGFPIIDARPVAARTEELFPGKGLELGNAWRTRQFEPGFGRWAATMPTSGRSRSNR